MSKKRPPLPNSGGSYLRKGSKLEQVEAPTRELPRSAAPEAVEETAPAPDEKESSK